MYHLSSTVKNRRLSTIAFIVSLLILLPTFSALATTSASSSDAQTIRPLPTGASEMPSTPIALDERSQARVTNLAANLSTRMDNTAARLTQISGRLETRIDIESAAGKDVTLARAHLSDAKNELLNAASALENIDSAVAAMVSAADSRAQWLSLRNTYTEIANNLRQAHESLRSAADSLRTSGVTSTSTTATSTN